MLATDTLVCTLILLAMAIVPSAGTIHSIEAKPVKIIVGVTKTLDVNCSLTADGADIAALISLTLSRANGSSQSFIDLAIISSVAPDTVNVITNESIITAGVLDGRGESYLHLRWDNPTALQDGVYQCAALGLDKIGIARLLKQVTVVIMTQTTTQDYVTIISQQKNALKQCDERMHLLDKYTSQYKADHLDLPFLSYKGSKYYLAKIGFTDIDLSLKLCKEAGGQLVEINDAGEYQAIKAFLNKNHPKVDYVIIAGSDRVTYDVWVLPSTNKSLPFEAWIPDRPFRGIENAAACIWLTRGNQWQMVDWDCTFGPAYHTIRYMCEIPSLWTQVGSA